jgi:NTE family protein
MEWGLMLCDDGSKGTYEVGVWRGLLACNVKLSVVHASSASLINGALIAQGRMDAALAYWSTENQNPLVAFSQQLAHQYATQWARLEPDQWKDQLRQVFLDTNPSYQRCKAFLSVHLNQQDIRHSPVRFLLDSYDPVTFQPVQWAMTDLSSEEWLDTLLIGFFYPIFHSMISGRSSLSDEGTMLQTALKDDNLQWITVGFQSSSLARWKKHAPTMVHTNVVPSEYLGLTMDADQGTLLRNMDLGYLDTLKNWHQLSGKTYFIDLNAPSALWSDFIKRLGYPIPGDAGMKLGMLLGSKPATGKEEILGALGHLLDKTTFKGQSLSLSLLEITARALHVPRLKRYTGDEMIEEIFQSVNELLSKHLHTIKRPENIAGMFKGEAENYLPMDPLSFLSAYVYFLSMPGHSSDVLAKLTQQYSPETLLGITTLLYLGEN